ncbi:MAG TPA: 30S ribosome-binding factor RbfA [bacterium]|nr:30S ribosome-binding factor RbfA [bacterium]
MIPNRLKRVSQLILQTVSDVIRKEIKDPRIGFVTVTDVDVAPDLRAAKVFISVIGDEKQRNQSIKGLNSAAGFVHQRLRQEIRIKRVPMIKFYLDNSIERGVNVCSLIEKVRIEDEEILNKKPSG